MFVTSHNPYQKVSIITTLCVEQGCHQLRLYFRLDPGEKSFGPIGKKFSLKSDPPSPRPLNSDFEQISDTPSNENPLIILRILQVLCQG